MPDRLLGRSGRRARDIVLEAPRSRFDETMVLSEPQGDQVVPTRRVDGMFAMRVDQ